MEQYTWPDEEKTSKIILNFEEQNKTEEAKLISYNHYTVVSDLVY